MLLQLHEVWRHSHCLTPGNFKHPNISTSSQLWSKPIVSGQVKERSWFFCIALINNLGNGIPETHCNYWICLKCPSLNHLQAISVLFPFDGQWSPFLGASKLWITNKLYISSVLISIPWSIPIHILEWINQWRYMPPSNLLEISSNSFLALCWLPTISYLDES